MKVLKALPLLLMIIVGVASEVTEKSAPQSTFARTEIRVAKSLNAEDTETLNVMTREGKVAQLIVKRRDPKSKSTSSSINSQTLNQQESNDLTRSFYSNWFPMQSVYLQPNLIRLNRYAIIKNSTNPKPINNNLANIVSSDRIPHVPNPITIRSGDVYVKPTTDRVKKARSLVEIDTDGIPVVHGVRVPDDESDEKVWRNARVINGELVPYEKGYKPPAAVPIGELVYPSKIKKEPFPRGIGPFSTADNYEKLVTKNSFGPFTVKDNQPSPDKPKQNKETHYVKFSSSDGLGPFTIADNSKPINSKLFDYIKEINDNESKRDYYSSRRYRSYNSEEVPQMQRRMLQNIGSPSYPTSALYSPSSTKLSPVNFNEGVRTPILQYAHPELGVQPAKATPEKEMASDYKYKDNDVNQSPYDLNPQANDDLDARGSFPQNYYDNGNINDISYYKKDVINYPFNNYYINRKSNQPFWIRLTESIKDNVQSGFERMHQLTRPVFDPILEATHKITHNLGFTHMSPQRAQDKVDIITPIGSSAILPALGLVAGGAALGLGAAAVGRFLQPEEMRGLHGFTYPNDILVIMEETNHGLQEHKRLKRSLERYDEQNLQKLSSNLQNSRFQHLTSSHFWTDTPCAKKIFCEAMLRQNSDEVVFMEKKMESLLLTLSPEVMQNVAQHFQEVMSAVKSRSCYTFTCSRNIPIPFV